MADRRLQVFVSVARLLSFTKAAEALHMTQPAVTFQIRQLEDHFNTRLFDRAHNRISLTEAGQRVLGFAEQIFALYAEMDSSVQSITGEVSGELELGASTTIAEYMLPSLLGLFKTRYPDVTIRLKVGNTDTIVQMVENNLIDLGVVEARVENRNLVVEPCHRDRMVLIVPPGHELAGEGPVSLRRVMQYPYICREQGSGTREVLLQQIEAAGLDSADLDIVLELGSPESIKGAVEAGMGISILSRTIIDKEVKLGTLVPVEIDPPIERPFLFVHQKQKFRLRAVDELLTFVREYCCQQEQGTATGATDGR